MKRNHMSAMSLNEELLELWGENTEVYEQTDVDQLLDEGPRLLDSYYMVKELHGEDSKLAKESLQELFEYIEEMKEC